VDNASAEVDGMMQSEIIKISIQRPYAEVYDFLADRLNFGRWASIPHSGMVPLGGEDWLVELPTSGKVVIRFTAPNPYGVLDYQIFPQGAAGGPETPVRLVPNEDGCELLLVWFRRPGVDETRFASDVEWARSDLERLKVLLEVG
jgi:hypothetical protein